MGGSSVAEIHQQVACNSGGPRPGRMRCHADQMCPAGLTPASPTGWSGSIVVGRNSSKCLRLSKISGLSAQLRDELGGQVAAAVRVLGEFALLVVAAGGGECLASADGDRVGEFLPAPALPAVAVLVELPEVLACGVLEGDRGVSGFPHQVQRLPGLAPRFGAQFGQRAGGRAEVDTGLAGLVEDAELGEQRGHDRGPVRRC